jgi:uncharacterized protein (TIGR04255 family)
VPIGLPIQISPSPIVDVTAELRLESTVPPAVFIGLCYEKLIQQFPKVAQLQFAPIPDQLLKLNPALAYQPQFRFESDDFVALLGPNIFAVGANGPYPGWPAARKGFNAAISLFASLDVVKTLHYFGLKYVNFFPGNVLSKLEIALAIKGTPVSGEGTFIKTLFSGSAFKLQIQVHTEAKITSNTPKLIIDPNVEGTIVSLDCYQDPPPSLNAFFSDVEKNLEAAHEQEKELFFKLLKGEFLQTLNPRYE